MHAIGPCATPRVARCSAWALLLLAFWCVSATSVRAQHVSVRSFGEAEGLEDDAVWHLAQEPAGALLVGTESGLFLFDGRIFFHIGTDEGVPSHIGVRAVAIAPDGRIAVADDHRILLSRTAVDAEHPVTMLHFDDVTYPLRPESQAFGALIWWRGWLLAQSNGHVIPIRGIGSAPFPDGVRSLINASGLAIHGDALWVGTSDGHLCTVTPFAAQCAEPVPQGSGASRDDWAAVAVGPDGTVYARSAGHFALRGPGDLSFRVEPLEDDRVADGFQNHVRLAIMPGGAVVTEALGHLMVRHGDTWHTLALPPEYADSLLAALLPGHDGELWIGVPGLGLSEAVNFGRIENYTQSDGLDGGDIWQITRPSSGPLLIGTSRGIARLQGNGAARLDLVPNRASYMVQGDASGGIWASHGVNQLIWLDKSGHERRVFKLPSLHQIILTPGGTLWILTGQGLLHIDTRAGRDARIVADPAVRTPVLAGTIGADGRMWLAGSDRLMIRQPDGRIETALDHWSSADFVPQTLVALDPDHVWIGGSGGLMSVIREPSGRAVITPVQGPHILARTFYALARDARGRIWAGTDHGVAAFDGGRWINITTGNGLVWNDVDEYGAFVDADGSVWIGTSRGLSHLVRPDLLFRTGALHAVISTVQFGSRPYQGHAVPFSYDPLVVRFSVQNLPRASGMHFRYRLAGVDRDWIETTTNFVRYPSLPAGHHDFAVVAVDPMTGEESSPQHILLRMRMPWWRWWPCEVAYGLSGLFGLWGILHFRSRMLEHQRRILRQTVARRTRELEAARAALEHEARTDSVTGLLNRRAIQQHLSDHLSDARFAVTHGHHQAANTEAAAPCAIALLDIDHFKRINDVHGHLVGDHVLRQMGERLLDLLGPEEHCGRYGGEEFLFISVAGGAAGPRRFGELIRALTQVPFGMPDAPVTLTLSVGIATVQPSDSWQSVIGRADRALYDAKASGRDCIVEAA